MKPSHLLLFSALLMAFVSCQKITGEGPIETETRNASGFSGIDLRLEADVYFKQDSAYKVEVHAQRNILDKLQTIVVNDNLVIKPEPQYRFRTHEPIQVFVSGPALNTVRVNGSGNINTTTAITTDRLDADVSGSGDITITELHAGSTEAAISGSGNITVNSGVVADEKTKISGSGNINLSNVAAQTATTTTSGSGDTKLDVAQSLDVTISGSGSVFYKGNPVVNVQISGSGKVVRL